MAITIEQFKQAFSSHASDDPLKRLDQQAEAALKDLSKQVTSLDASAVDTNRHKAALIALTKSYAQTKQRSGQAKPNLEQELTRIRQEALAIASTAPAAPASAAITAAAVPVGQGPAIKATLISVVVIRPAALQPGGQEQLVAKGMYSDNSLKTITDKVKWISSDEEVLKILPGGLAKVAQSAGDVTVTAEMPRDDGHPGTRRDSVTVKIRFPLEKIIVTPQNPLVEGGQVEVMTATAVYTDKSTEVITESVKWSSSRTNVADVAASMQRGAFISGEAGTATLSATDEASTIKGSTTLTVPAAGTAPTVTKVTISPINPDIKTGQPVQFTAMGHFSDKSTHEITRNVRWESSDPRVIAIDARGLATPTLVSGNPWIRGLHVATQDEQTTQVFVEIPAVKRLILAPKTISIVSGDAVAVTVTAILAGGARMKVNHVVQWTVSNSAAAMMIQGNERIQGLAPDDVLIEAYEPFSEEKDTLALKVLPPVLRSIFVTNSTGAMSLRVTEKLQLEAAGTLSNGLPAPPLKKLHWGTTKPNFIDVSPNGEVTAIAPGRSEISATVLKSGVSGSIMLEAVP